MASESASPANKCSDQGGYDNGDAGDSDCYGDGCDGDGDGDGRRARRRGFATDTHLIQGCLSPAPRQCHAAFWIPAR
eukprot:5522939-Pyramimonas_sp.AAC.1